MKCIVKGSLKLVMLMGANLWYMTVTLECQGQRSTSKVKGQRPIFTNAPNAQKRQLGAPSGQNRIYD